MNILITGANGQLGNEMRVLSAAHPQHTYYFTDVQECAPSSPAVGWTWW